jgi:hypothetical protein
VYNRKFPCYDEKKFWKTYTELLLSFSSDYPKLLVKGFANARTFHNSVPFLIGHRSHADILLATPTKLMQLQFDATSKGIALLFDLSIADIAQLQPPLSYACYHTTFNEWVHFHRCINRGVME